MAQDQAREKGKTKGRNEGVGKEEVGKGESGVTSSYVMKVKLPALRRGACGALAGQPPKGSRSKLHYTLYKKVSCQGGFLITRGEKVDEKNGVFVTYHISPCVLPSRVLTHPLTTAR
jgi:hypothetical protein